LFYRGRYTGEAILSKSEFTGLRSSMQSLQDQPLTDVSENHAMDLVKPVIEETSIPLNKEGISDEEIVEIFGSLDNPDSIFMSVAMVQADNIVAKSDAVDCILRSTGISELHSAYWGNF